MTLKRKLTGLAVLVGMIAALLAATTGTAAGASAESTVDDVGTLDLVLDSSEGTKLDYYSPAVASPVPSEEMPDITQRLANKLDSCELDFDPHPEILLAFTSAEDITPNPPTNWPGMVNFSVGVGADNEGAGTPCGTSDRKIKGKNKETNNQQLTLTLGSDLADKWIHGGELWLKLKFDTMVSVDLLDEDEEVIPNAGATLLCGDASDCGSDSGADIKRAVIKACENPGADAAGNAAICDGTEVAYLGKAIRISISSPQGSAGLEDLFGSKDSFLTIAEQFDGVINCGDTQEVPGADLLLDASGTFIRLNNADKPSVVCNELKGVNFEAVSNQVEFAIAAGAIPFNGRYVGRIDFPARLDSAGPLLLQYDPAGGTDFQPSLACVGADNAPPAEFVPLPADLNQALDGLGFHDASDPLLKFDVDPPGFNPNSPAETWCTIALRSITQGDGSVQDVYWVFGYGDPNWGGF